MADAYRALHPRGTAVVTQFSARPQLLVRLEKNHRPTAFTYAEAVFSPLIPRPTPESIRYDFANLMYCLHLTMFVTAYVSSLFCLKLTPKILM
jgi:hypothetical protein